jgi:hypothetical protein
MFTRFTSYSMNCWKMPYATSSEIGRKCVWKGMYIIISLLMSPLLGHRPSLWITHKENEPQTTTRAQCGLVAANDCKCSRDQQLKCLPKQELEILNFGHPFNDRPTLLNFRDYMPKRTDHGAIELLACMYITYNLRRIIIWHQWAYHLSRMQFLSL